MPSSNDGKDAFAYAMHAAGLGGLSKHVHIEGKAAETVASTPGGMLYATAVCELEPRITCPNCGALCRDLGSAKLEYDIPVGLHAYSLNMKTGEPNRYVYHLEPCGCRVNQEWAGAMKAEVNRRVEGKPPQTVVDFTPLQREKRRQHLQKHITELMTLQKKLGADTKAAEAVQYRLVAATDQLMRLIPGPHNKVVSEVQLNDSVKMWAEKNEYYMPSNPSKITVGVDLGAQVLEVNMQPAGEIKPGDLMYQNADGTLTNVPNGTPAIGAAVNGYGPDYPMPSGMAGNPPKIQVALAGNSSQANKNGDVFGPGVVQKAMSAFSQADLLKQAQLQQQAAQGLASAGSLNTLIEQLENDKKLLQQKQAALIGQPMNAYRSQLQQEILQLSGMVAAKEKQLLAQGVQDVDKTAQATNWANLTYESLCKKWDAIKDKISYKEKLNRLDALNGMVYTAATDYDRQSLMKFISEKVAELQKTPSSMSTAQQPAVEWSKDWLKEMNKLGDTKPKLFSDLVFTLVMKGTGTQQELDTRVTFIRKNLANHIINNEPLATQTHEMLTRAFEIAKMPKGSTVKLATGPTGPTPPDKLHVGAIPNADGLTTEEFHQTLQRRKRRIRRIEE